MTFKITSKRSDHSFELDSREPIRPWGCCFEVIPNVQVKMADIDLREIREEAAYLL